MPHFLDVEKWPRRAAFEFFRGYDNPYFNVCAPLDVTALVELTRSSRSIRFSLASIYFALKAANECEPFRYRLQNGRVLVHERIHAGTTALLADERLAFVYYDYHPSFPGFREGAARAVEALSQEAKALDARAASSDLIHFSSLPWVAFTSISHARNWGREDSVPKITFGRYSGDRERTTLPVSVEVHHGLMDGVHVARYLDLLQGYFAAPADELGES